MALTVQSKRLRPEPKAPRSEPKDLKIKIAAVALALLFLGSVAIAFFMRT